MVWGSKKQVLLVGNDGVQLYVIKSKRVSLYADFSDSAQLTADLVAAFKDVDAPLTILFDVVEQQYRRETIPKVGFTDKRKIIRRKLQMTFPQQQMRAFLPLKQTGGRQGEGITALFAGLVPNLTISQIMDAVISSEVSIDGAGLLPLESTALVQRLASGMHKKDGLSGNARWSILMTFHKTGGLRQVVIKDGELALTRLTPLAASVDNTQDLVAEMGREFASTLTYLSRFGYVGGDGLDLVVVSSESVCRLLQSQRLQVTNLYALTLFEASQLAGFVSVVPSGAGPHADILHAGWLGSQSKLLVPLSSIILDKVKQSRQFAQLAMLILILGLGYLVWQIFNLQAGIVTMRKDVSQLQVKRATLQIEHDSLAKKLNTLKYDPAKTRSVLDIHDQLDKNHIDAEPVLALINSAIDHEKIQIKTLEVIPSLETPGSGNMAANMPVEGDSSGQKIAKPSVQISLALSFADDVLIENAANMTNELADALRARLPEWKIDIKEIAGNLSIDKTVQGVSEQIAKDQVEGRMIKDGTSALIMTGELP